MKLFLFTLLISLEIALLSAGFQQSKSIYPTIVVDINVCDKHTKRIVQDAVCLLELTYQTQKCLPYPHKPFEPYSETKKFQMLSQRRTFVVRNFVKLYKVVVQHPNYQIATQSDSTNLCDNMVIEVELEPKK